MYIIKTMKTNNKKNIIKTMFKTNFDTIVIMYIY